MAEDKNEKNACYGAAPRPHNDWKCNGCNKQIEVAFQIRLCDDCLTIFEKERDEKIAKHGKWVMTDEEHAKYFLPHPENRN